MVRASDRSLEDPGSSPGWISVSFPFLSVYIHSVNNSFFPSMAVCVLDPMHYWDKPCIMQLRHACKLTCRIEMAFAFTVIYTLQPNSLNVMRCCLNCPHRSDSLWIKHKMYIQLIIYLAITVTVMMHVVLVAIPSLQVYDHLMFVAQLTCTRTQCIQSGNLSHKVGSQMNGRWTLSTSLPRGDHAKL